MDDAAGVVELIVDGAVTGADYEKLPPVLEDMIARHGKLRES